MYVVAFSQTTVSETIRGRSISGLTRACAGVAQPVSVITVAKPALSDGLSDIPPKPRYQDVVSTRMRWTPVR